MNNMPKEKIAIVAVSRDCFPMTLSENRRKALVKAYQNKYGEIYECPVCVENDICGQRLQISEKQAAMLW